MKKQIAQVGLIASLVLAGITAAHAGTPATVTVSGAVVSTSCNLDVGGSTDKNLPLGGWVSTQFSPGADALAGLHVVTSSMKKIPLKLSHCAGKGNSDALDVKVTGTTVSGHDNLFNENGGNAGIALTVVPAGGTETLVTDNGQYTAYQYDAGATADTADSTVLTFDAYMASSQAGPAVQEVSAPISFDVVNG